MKSKILILIFALVLQMQLEAAAPGEGPSPPVSTGGEAEEFWVSPKIMALNLAIRSAAEISRWIAAKHFPAGTVPRRFSPQMLSNPIFQEMMRVKVGTLSFCLRTALDQLAATHCTDEEKMETIRDIADALMDEETSRTMASEFSQEKLKELSRRIIGSCKDS